MARAPDRQRPGELPAEVTGFVGRRAELAQLAGQLRSARLVTVTGPGGVGKTRVALRTAARYAGQFSDGVCLAELAGLRDPGLLPHTVATCLGLPEQDARAQLDAVLDYLRGRQLLLILDTCEHLVDACAMLAHVLLRQTAQVTVLATSRQPLDVPGEHTCLIPPLPVPEPASRHARKGDAVELFAQRAAAAVPGFAVTEASRADVIRLCRRLDGIPLAIELAAARLRAVPLGQLAQRLEDRFRPPAGAAGTVLTGERRAALPHHQTLRTATQWSYDLCSPAEQLLWARLSVFAGSFDVPGAEEVCTGDPLPREDILPTLIGLVDKSVALRAGEDEGGTRYRLLDTIREFGTERLAATGAETALRDRHITYYLAMAEYFDTHASDGDQLPRFHELRRQHDNIRAAIEYALDRPERERDAARLAASLSVYWQISSLLREGRHWLTRALGRFPGPSPERAWLLVIRGLLAAVQGEAADALADLEQGTPMADELGEDAISCRGYVFLNLAFAFAGRFAEAAAMGALAAGRAQEAERIQTPGYFSALVSLDTQMAYLHLLTGDLDGAIGRCARGLQRLGEGSGERWHQSYLNLITGLALRLRGEHTASAAATRKALTMKHELGDNFGTAYCLEALAWLAADQQRCERTAWLLGTAEPLWERSGRRLGGDIIMEEFHQRAEKTARDTLGGDHYVTLCRRAAGLPLDQIITLAVTDADELQPAASQPADPARRSARRLTSREQEIAALVTEGLSNREIAERLLIAKRTVDAHVEHILIKLGVTSRVQIATWLQSGQQPSP